MASDLGPSPSIQSLSAIQSGPGGPHHKKNNTTRDVREGGREGGSF